MGTLQIQPAEAVVVDRLVEERALEASPFGIGAPWRANSAGSALLTASAPRHTLTQGGNVSEDGTADAAGASACDVITAMVLEYSTMLYRVAYSITRNAAEAEDAVQEAFLRVLRNQEKLGEIRDVRIWLIRITWNLVLDRKRRTKVRPETEDVADLARTLADVQPSADETLASAQSCRRILELIDRLPSKERQALMLSAIEELTTAEIAGVLGTTESSVRSRIFRARRELSLLLDAERIVR